MINIKNKKDTLNKIVGTKLSGKYELSYSGEDSKFNYSGKGGISTGKNLGIDTLNANFSFLGNQDFVDIFLFIPFFKNIPIIGSIIKLINIAIKTILRISIKAFIIPLVSVLETLFT